MSLGKKLRQLSSVVSLDQQAQDIAQHPRIGIERMENFAHNLEKKLPELRLKLMGMLDESGFSRVNGQSATSLNDLKQISLELIDSKHRKKFEIILLLIDKSTKWLEAIQPLMKTKAGHVLRDSMQSTGLWCFDTSKIKEIVQLSVKVGFNFVELFGGQSFQTALLQKDAEGNPDPVDPFDFLRMQKEAIDEITHQHRPSLKLAFLNIGVKENKSLQNFLSNFGFDIDHLDFGSDIESELQKEPAKFKNLWNFFDEALKIPEGPRAPIQGLVRASMFSFENHGRTLAHKTVEAITRKASDHDPRSAIQFRTFCALNDPKNSQYVIEAVACNNARAGQHNAKVRAARQLFREHENQIENITDPKEREIVEEYLPQSYHNLADVQAAISYSKHRRVEYYFAYAKKILAMGQAFAQLEVENRGMSGPGRNPIASLVIKSYSGDLPPGEVEPLITELKKLGLPVYLHLHATNLQESGETLGKAIEKAEVDEVDLSVGCLSGGTAHHDAAEISALHGGNMLELDNNNLWQLKRTMDEAYGQGCKRVDKQLPDSLLKEFQARGIAGGSIPYVMNNINTNLTPYLKNQMSHRKKSLKKLALEAYFNAFDELHEKMGRPDLVTPVMDILGTKQSILCAMSQITGQPLRYDNRFVRLVLGYYGDFIDHTTGKKIPFAEDIVQDALQYCQNHKGGLGVPEAKVLEKHATEVVHDDWEESEAKVREIVKQYPELTISESKFMDLTIYHILHPANPGYKNIVEYMLEAQCRREGVEIKDSPSLKLKRTLASLADNQSYSLLSPAQSLLLNNDQEIIIDQMLDKVFDIPVLLDKLMGNIDSASSTLKSHYNSHVGNLVDVKQEIVNMRKRGHSILTMESSVLDDYLMTKLLLMTSAYAQEKFTTLQREIGLDPLSKLEAHFPQV